METKNDGTEILKIYEFMCENWISVQKKEFMFDNENQILDDL